MMPQGVPHQSYGQFLYMIYLISIPHVTIHEPTIKEAKRSNHKYAIQSHYMIDYNVNIENYS